MTRLGAELLADAARRLGADVTAEHTGGNVWAVIGTKYDDSGKWELCFGGEEGLIVEVDHFTIEGDLHDYQDFHEPETPIYVDSYDAGAQWIRTVMAADDPVTLR